MDKFLLAYAGGEVHKKDIDFLLQSHRDLTHKLNIARSTLKYLQRVVKPAHNCTKSDLESIGHVLEMTEPTMKEEKK